MSQRTRSACSGGRLSREGALQGATSAINTDVNNQMYPTLATNEQDRYLVVWQGNRWGDWDIFGQFLDANAKPVGGSIWLDISNADETHPEVTANGASRKYVVVYQKSTAGGESIWANQINENAVSLNWFEVSAGGLGDNGSPAVGTHLSGYLLAYEWESWSPETRRDVYGRLWSPHALSLPMVLRNLQ